MTPVFTIFKKELRDTLRDRRTLISSIIMPIVIMPLLILGQVWFAAYQQRQTEAKELRLGVINQEQAPDLVSYLDNQPKIQITPLTTDASSAVRHGTVDVAMVIPPDWQPSISTQKKVNLDLLYNSTKSDSSSMMGRIASAVQGYDATLVEQRMREQNVSASILDTAAVVPQDVATSKERGGFVLSFLLPMFLVLWAVLGGMYTAIDASAGEKERKTLEALLSTPVRRLEIVLGKLMAVATTAIITVTLALASLYIAMQRLGTSGIFGQGPASSAVNMSLDASSVLVMFGVGVLLAVMFGSLELSLSIFAKSYREANTYLTPLYMLAILPVVIINTMTNLQPNLGLFAIPAVNAVLLFKEVLLGTLNPAHVAVTLASLAVLASASIAISARIYERESVLFRS